VAATVIYDEAKVFERYGLRPDQMLDYKALKGDTSDNIPGVPGVGEKTAIQLLQQFGSLDEIYKRLDEVKGKLRERLAEHRESAFMSREIGRIITDLPVELNLEEARTGRYDRRAVAQRFRELEFRSLIDRLPASSIAPSGYDGPEESGGGLQLSLELLGGRAGASAGSATDGVEARPREQPDPLADPGGAIEHVDPRVVRSDADRTDLDAWLESHEGSLGIGWSAGAGRPLERPLFGVALAAADGSSWYVPWSDDRPLPAWFGRDDRDLVGHDLKQLIVMLAARGTDLRGACFDTLVAGYMVNPALRAQTLEDVVSTRYGGVLPDRPLTPETGAEQDVGARRAAAEALTSLLVRPALETDLTEGGLMSLFREVEMPLVPVLARMELAGVALDLGALAAMRDEFAATLAALESRIYELVGHPFNIGSPKQLEQILFTELGLPATKRTRTGFSTDASVLEELREQHEVIGLILEHRQVSKLKSTYVDALPTLVNPRTGRVHTSFNQVGSATGRLSSTEPNVQNIPVRTELGRRVRSAFMADASAGWMLLAADYSQIELRILAHLSKEPGLLDAFRNGEDIHSATARAMYGEDDVTPAQRRVAKILNFGVIYGLGPHGVARQTDLTRQQGQEFIDLYFGKYPGLREYIDGVKAVARERGFAETLTGRRRYLPEIKSQNGLHRSAAERVAVNMPIQGTAADIIKIAMVNIDNEMKKQGMRSKMLIQVHDELIFEVAKGELLEMQAMARELMPGAMKLDVPLTVETKTGVRWGDME
jgi:DNA polymerase-1